MLEFMVSCGIGQGAKGPVHKALEYASDVGIACIMMATSREFVINPGSTTGTSNGFLSKTLPSGTTNTSHNKKLIRDAGEPTPVMTLVNDPFHPFRKGEYFDIVRARLTMIDFRDKYQLHSLP